MTIKYLDYEGGNDSNDGTTYANRKLTLASALSGLTAGAHEIRIKASPAPTSIGSATWTNDSGTVTLAGAVTANIDDGETAWTAAANVTATASTTTYREGAKSVNLVVAAGFTTGKAAYRATGTLDLSGYQQVSFWVRSSGTHAAGVFEIKLCTDTVGDVVAHTISVPQIQNNAVWYSFTVDLAANMDSAIASVALYAASDPGSVTVNLDNIIACKAASDDASLTLNSLISKNVDADDPWFGIESINGTTVKLRTATTATAAKGTYETRWYGTTGSATTYKREAIALTGVQTLTVDGTSPETMFVVSGGWNRTDMSTQDSVSWFRPSVGGYNLWSMSTFTYHVKIDKIYVANVYSGNYGIIFTQGCTGGDLADGAAASCATAFWFNTTAYASNIRYATGCSTAILVGNGDSDGCIYDYIRFSKIWGMKGSSDSNTSTGFSLDMGANYEGDVHIDGDEMRNCRMSVNVVDNAAYRVYVRNCNFSNSYYACLPGFKTVVHFDNCYLGSALVGAGSGRKYFRKYDQTVDDHRIYMGDLWNSLVSTATDQQYDVSSLSWKFQPKKAAGSSDGFWSSRYPIWMVLAKVACNANEARTVKIWVRRDNTGLSMRLRVQGRQIAGVSSDVTATISAAANTWEQLTINFTPTESGIVEVLAEAWGGSTYSGWFNLLEVT